MMNTGELNSMYRYNEPTENLRHIKLHPDFTLLVYSIKVPIYTPLKGAIRQPNFGASFLFPSPECPLLMGNSLVLHVRSELFFSCGYLHSCVNPYSLAF